MMGGCYAQVREDENQPMPCSGAVTGRARLCLADPALCAVQVLGTRTAVEEFSCDSKESSGSVLEWGTARGSGLKMSGSPLSEVSGLIQLDPSESGLLHHSGEHSGRRDSSPLGVQSDF